MGFSNNCADLGEWRPSRPVVSRALGAGALGLDGPPQLDCQRQASGKVFVASRRVAVNEDFDGMAPERGGEQLCPVWARVARTADRRRPIFLQTLLLRLSIEGCFHDD